MVSVFALYVVFFFFKQKTAYEMRISDWSSDVCSSDLSNEQMLPIAAVVQETGLSRSLLYKLIANGEFPSGVSMSLRRVAWPRSEVQAFIGRDRKIVV